MLGLPAVAEREPDAATDMSAAWVRLRQQGKGRFRWTTASALMARRRLAQTAGPGVLSGSAPGTWEHTLHSVTEFEDDIRRWINEWNKNPKPFVWTKTADEILETLAAYCQRIIDSGH